MKYIVLLNVLSSIVFQIKLVNINASDVVDGKSAVVLGLIWTIILYFQVRIFVERFIRAVDRKWHSFQNGSKHLLT